LHMKMYERYSFENASFLTQFDYLKQRD